ncbi:MAG: biotin--[acetyl-CoA-carboxylase] ligase [Burkholderiales bacterium]|nr:biotin--[acetyl-CoA-carboxylase] ligase [Burkholderiales bacterium]
MAARTPRKTASAAPVSSANIRPAVPAGSLTFRLLKELATGGFQSGTVLAEKLGVSRSAVSDALKDVEDHFGIALFRVQKKGYKLPEPIEFLDPVEIGRHLGAEAAARIKLDLREEATSTNSLLMDRAETAANGTVLIAEHQTAGRGRLGRAWQSCLGGGLTFSILWRFPGGAGSLAGLSLAVAVAVLRGLRAARVPGVEVKWPNDLISGFRKVGGILIETQGDMLGPSTAVIGIGLNFRLPDEVKDRIDQPVADLVSLAPGASRNRVFAEVLKALVAVLEEFEREGFAPFRAEWDAAHAYQGRPVRVQRPGEPEMAGEVEGIAGDGALLVRVGLLVQRLNSAEISLRLPKTSANTSAKT